MSENQPFDGQDLSLAIDKLPEDAARMPVLLDAAQQADEADNPL